MLNTAKIIGLSALLSAGIVTAYELPQAREAAPVAKKYTDRLPTTGAAVGPVVAYAVPAAPAAGEAKGDIRKGDLLRMQMDDRCTGAAWPNVPRDCLVADAGATVRKPARTITIEERTTPSTSALVRLPVADVASR
jgi:hypothetical protein